MIEEKGFEGITIRDLTAKAGINRGTFYLHYRDKYDLMEKLQSDILQGFLEIILQLNPIEAIKYFSQNAPYPIMVQIFDYLKGYGRILKVLLSSKGDPAFPKKMKDLIRNNIYEKLVKNKESTLKNVSIAQEYLPAIGTSANFGVIEQWLENGMIHSPEEMAMIYFKIINFIRSIEIMK
ncbi:AcrR family transcriptional regulator [Neobacillus ginsengisoli]|uniref:AcrR family transcriptional regulator n=1 Tax=Neobacillus ginsengisoli TaxID=904295 RepID=A0ABT9XX04_9BACI|nr:AcrR family transcriptional regulator [Neobacillus ginsengisoli]